jgi:hypothetical protein
MNGHKVTSDNGGHRANFEIKSILMSSGASFVSPNLDFALTIEYHKFGWGLTASDGPGPAVLEIDGVRRVFYDYDARGAPFGPDDGTISPWAVVASLPFAPEIVIDTVRHAIERLNLKGHSPYGFDASFNATYPETARNPHGWVSP